MLAAYVALVAAGAGTAGRGLGHCAAGPLRRWAAGPGRFVGFAGCWLRLVSEILDACTPCRGHKRPRSRHGSPATPATTAQTGQTGPPARPSPPPGPGPTRPPPPPPPPAESESQSPPPRGPPAQDPG